MAKADVAQQPPDLPEASPIIISESRTHIVVAVEISKTKLVRHRRFIENLLAHVSLLRL
jgi:hypothetical protein